MLDLVLKEIISTISKLSKPDMIQKLEEKRSDLESEKEILEKEINNKKLNESEFKKLYMRIKTVIENPSSVWEMGTLGMRIGLVKLLFGEKACYTKKEKY